MYNYRRYVVIIILVVTVIVVFLWRGYSSNDTIVVHDSFADEIYFRDTIKSKIYVKHDSKFDQRKKEKIVSTSGCTLVTVEELIEYGMNHRYPNGIPKIIHYLYRNESIPIQYSPHIKQCISINTNVKFIFWTDNSATEFIKKYFPKHFEIYSSYLNPEVEALKLPDVQRYFIMYKFGGVYMDMDTRCQKPFDIVMATNSCFLSQEVHLQSQILWNIEYLAMNSLMGCVSEHNFFKLLTESIKRADKSSVLEQTGPFWMTEMHKFYLQFANRYKGIQDVISLADPYFFSPLVERNLEIRCTSKTEGSWRIRGCQSLKDHRQIEEVKEQAAISVHLSLHLRYEDRHKLIKQRDNLCHVSDNVYLIEV